MFSFCYLCGCKPQNKNHYFLGTITYSYTYSSDSLNVDSLARERPSKGYFRYDSSDYQSMFIGKDTTAHYYSGELNKAVSEMGRGVYECGDYSVASDSVVSVKTYDTDEKILGYSCGIIEIQKSRSWVQYYFAKELKMAPPTYQIHRSFNWNTYGIKTNGGLVLKLEHRFKTFTMTGVATGLSVKDNKFVALEIQDSLFSKICK